MTLKCTTNVFQTIIIIIIIIIIISSSINIITIIDINIIIIIFCGDIFPKKYTIITWDKRFG